MWEDNPVGVIPRVILVGQAYEDVNDPKNVLGTYYSPDETGICYFGNTCVRDAWLVDFDWNGTADLPLGRIDGNNLTEIQNSVQTFVDMLTGSHISQPKAFIMDGDLASCSEITEEPTASLLAVQQLYNERGIPTTLVKDSQFADCYDLGIRQNAARDAIQSGITEMVGSGYISTRRRSPALLIQNDFTPYWTMGLVPRQQRIVAWFPGCDFGDGDRINTGNTPMVELFTTAPPSGTTAAFWTSHGRGAWGRAHLLLLREVMEWRFSNQCYDTYEVVFRAVQSLASTQPGLIDYLGTVHNYGWPVSLPDFPQMPGPTSIDEHIDLETTKWMPSQPNPFADETKLWYSLSKPSKVVINIVDVSGRLINQLANDYQGSGPHGAVWRGTDQNGRRVAAGVYYVHANINGANYSRSMVLLR